MADDYEIISQREIRKLREQLKGLEGANPVDSKEVRKSVDMLNERLDSLLDIFNSAVEDMREEDKEAEIIKDKINPIIEKLAQIDEQNRKLAQGMVAVNSLLDEKLGQANELIKAMNQSQQDLKETVRDVLQELRFTVANLSSNFSAPPAQGLDTQIDLSTSSSGSGSLRDLPPLPSTSAGMRPQRSSSGDLERKKFKLF